MIEQPSETSRVTLSFLLAGTCGALMSALAHSRAHRLSQALLCATLIYSILAFLKLIHSVALFFSRGPRNVIQWAHAFVFERLASLFIHPVTRVLGRRKKLQNSAPESRD